MYSTGLDVGTREISNQSLRTSTISIQSASGLTLDQMMTINGHINKSTATIYTRDSAQVMATYGAQIQGAVSGVPVTELPQFNTVMLRDGTTVTPRSILTTTEGGQGVVSVVDESVVETLVPDGVDITQATGSMSQPQQQAFLEGTRRVTSLPPLNMAAAGTSRDLSHPPLVLPSPLGDS